MPGGYGAGGYGQAFQDNWKEIDDAQESAALGQWHSDNASKAGKGDYLAWLESMKGAGGGAAQYLQDAQTGRNSVAQAQLREGLATTQRGMAAQSVGQGSNPLGERAALQAGAQAAAQTNAQAAQLRAQELGQAQQLNVNTQLGMGQQQAGMYGTQMNNYWQGQQNAQNQQTTDNAEDQAQFENISGAIKGVAGMAGGAMLSDKNSKIEIRNLRRENARLQERHDRWNAFEPAYYNPESGEYESYEDSTDVRKYYTDPPERQESKPRYEALEAARDAGPSPYGRKVTEQYNLPTGLFPDPPPTAGEVGQKFAQERYGDSLMAERQRAARTSRDENASRVARETEAASQELDAADMYGQGDRVARETEAASRELEEEDPEFRSYYRKYYGGR